MNRVTNLRVELDSVDFLVWIFNGCKWTVSRSTSADKVSRNFCNSIPVAHQDQLFVWCAGKKEQKILSKSVQIDHIRGYQHHLQERPSHPIYGSTIASRNRFQGLEYRVRKISGSISKEPSSYTEFGPPERTIPTGLIARTSSAEILWLFNSEKHQFHESDVK